MPQATTASLEAMAHRWGAAAARVGTFSQHRCVLPPGRVIVTCPCCKVLLGVRLGVPAICPCLKVLEVAHLGAGVAILASVHDSTFIQREYGRVR